MARSFSMKGVQGAADRAVQHARAWLLETEPGSRVHDVQSDPRFQHRGVDLLWELPSGEVRGIEVKGDRNATRKRYFFELVSNLEKDTPGCFLYSGADLLVYVFLSQGEMHVLPLRAARDWFLPRAKEYPLKHAFTQTGAIRYTTVGAVVSTRDVVEGVPNVLKIPLRRSTPLRAQEESAAPEPQGATAMPTKQAELGDMVTVKTADAKPATKKRARRRKSTEASASSGTGTSE
ncbi:hypothetical protein SAMN05443572_1011452 [Myxococcus fulvus]|uniref:Uncharacterized protein n=1 Tax=Myxococcus fulvus TaxID=33 RepID=A0A511SST8_MYXFU|nr:hypothetical protein [Myxococcus fulvus]AKF80075.1 hypothetical protein MFUL124B02_08145 [Myxococcus fulvus 124B02]GEN05004.1 hypothetical protein MFU01_00410 [Myxococcus fulvus]SET21055.1 hypothetical protein SAMN05443572_1011452 [Myxococcus fulvus]